MHDPIAPVPVELGAEFVHGHVPEVWNIVESDVLSACDVSGEHWCFHNGSLTQSDEVFGSYERVMVNAAGDKTFQELLDESGSDEETKAWASSYVEGYNAADKTRISVAALVRQEQAEQSSSGSGCRLVGGYDTIVHSLYRKIPAKSVYLNSVAKAIEWKRGSARVSIESVAHEDLGTLTAKAVVITVPNRVLTEHPNYPGGMVFHPEPSDALQAANRIAMGDAARISILFRERFWEAHEDLYDMSFLHSLEPWFPTWWTRVPVRAPLLTAWAGGPKAAQVSGLGEGAALDHALDSLAHILGMDRQKLRRMLVTSYFHDWSSDPFSRGAYSYLPVGALDAPEKLSRPVEDTLFFAGEATDYSGHYGTVHAAIASGHRAAEQILARRS